ncbi:MAG: CPBP family glutamic-type intramembrane protease [Fimbriiglobus sp.]
MDYFSATRHPWAGLVFLLPLLIVYEGGVLYFGGTEGIGIRGGADEWLRFGLSRYGLGQAWAAPILVVGVLLVQCFLDWANRPKQPVGICFGMLLESIAFAAILWAIARNFVPILDRLGVPLNSIEFNTPANELIRYIGAGIYEEVLFRLGLFSGLVILLRMVLLPTIVATVLAAIAGSVAFAAAHHVGPHGEPMVPIRFLFRATAGMFFTLLYIFRGFGVAVGAHAAYDILAGVSVGQTSAE